MALKTRAGRFSEREIDALDKMAVELGLSGSDTLRHCVRIASERHNRDTALLEAVEEIRHAISAEGLRITRNTVEGLIAQAKAG